MFDELRKETREWTSDDFLQTVDFSLCICHIFMQHIQMLRSHIQYQHIALYLIHRCTLSLLLTCFSSSWLPASDPAHIHAAVACPCERTVLAENKCASIITEDTICAMQLSGSGWGNSTLTLFLSGMCWLQLAALTLKRAKWKTDLSGFVTGSTPDSALCPPPWPVGTVIPTQTFPVNKNLILNMCCSLTTYLKDFPPYDCSISKHFLVDRIISVHTHPSFFQLGWKLFLLDSRSIDCTKPQQLFTFNTPKLPKVAFSSLWGPKRPVWL